MPKLSAVTSSAALMLSIVSLLLALSGVKPLPQQAPLVAHVATQVLYPIDHGGMG